MQSNSKKVKRHKRTILSTHISTRISNEMTPQFSVSSKRSIKAPIVIANDILLREEVYLCAKSLFELKANCSVMAKVLYP